jgi:FKBP-type peptidyl-prolyl cis-trans isomerase
MIKKSHFILILVLPGLVMCSRKKENAPTESQIKEAEEALIGVNRMLLQKDKARIIEYIDSNDLALKETETGLWFDITTKGSGPQVNEGSQVTIEYIISLLNGTYCYSSDSSGYKQFRIGQGGVENGLDEGMRMLTEGSEAIFILPPHLAHGLTGDGDRIPARSVIVYKVKLVKVEP